MGSNSRIIFNKESIEEIIIKYSLRTDYLTSDPYDIWKTSLGLIVKKKYYEHPDIIGPIAGIITLFDYYLNNKLRFFYTNQEYPIVRALAAMSLINLYSINKNTQLLSKAQQNIDWLIQNIYKSSSGYGWGLGFPWPAGKGIYYESNVPFSTHTPYPLEAIYSLNKLIGKDYIDVYKSIYYFFENDLQRLIENDAFMAISYGPMGDRIATNATSYALFVYALFTEIFPDEKNRLIPQIGKFYNFLKYTQNSQGGWTYMANDGNTFIDCFHSCFILENLKKTQRYYPSLIEENVINKGWEYIKNNLYIHGPGLFKRYAHSNKYSLIKWDLYDNAEALNTAILLGDEEIISHLPDNIMRHFYFKNHFYSAITKSGKKINRDTLRWAVMPLMFAFSNLLFSDVRNTGDN